jgi:hypothetical protein
MHRRPSAPSLLKRAQKEPPRGDESSQNVYSGLIVYVLLVLTAYILGRSFPATPKARPVPTSSRTICKHPPKSFDASHVKGSRVLIAGAAGFIGSHVAKCGDHCNLAPCLPLAYPLPTSYLRATTILHATMPAAVAHALEIFPHTKISGFSKRPLSAMAKKLLLPVLYFGPALQWLGRLHMLSRPCFIATSHSLQCCTWHIAVQRAFCQSVEAAAWHYCSPKPSMSTATTPEEPTFLRSCQHL